jgi:hypothetical protein
VYTLLLLDGEPWGHHTTHAPDFNHTTHAPYSNHTSNHTHDTPPPEQATRIRKHEAAAALFCVSTFQYIGCAIAFSSSYPFRAPIYRAPPRSQPRGSRPSAVAAQCGPVRRASDSIRFDAIRRELAFALRRASCCERAALRPYSSSNKLFCLSLVLLAAGTLWMTIHPLGQSVLTLWLQSEFTLFVRPRQHPRGAALQPCHFVGKFGSGVCRTSAFGTATAAGVRCMTEVYVVFATRSTLDAELPKGL